MISTKMLCRGMLVATTIAVTVLAAEAGPIKLSGSLITEYRDREGGNNGVVAVMQPAAQHGQFRLVQASLNLKSQLSDYTRFSATAVSGGAAPLISEAWLEFAGFPLEGDLTIGRFYKPRGAPLQTANLSYPALMFHTSGVIGMNLAQSYYPWRWEVGVVNNNALAAAGTALSNTQAFGRPAVAGVASNTNNREIYGFLGWLDGGTWGSLDVNLTYTIGEMTKADHALIASGTTFPQPTPMPGSINFDKTRQYWDLSADYMYGPYRVYGEYVSATEGVFAMHVWNAGASYRFGKYNVSIGYDRLNNNAVNRTQARPESWERKRYTVGGTYDYTRNIQFQLLHEWNYEYFESARDIKDGMDNDATIFQIVASF